MSGEDEPPPHGLGTERARLVRSWRGRLGVTQEQIADRVGVSLVWYARLERGEPANFSDDFVDRVAHHLRLSKRERLLLRLLASQRTRPPQGRGTDGKADAAAENLVHLVHQLPWAAYLCDEAWDIVACNTQFRVLCPWMDDERPNIMRMLVTHPEARRQIHAWKNTWVPRAVEELRMGYARHPHNPRVVTAIREVLEASDYARMLWLAPPQADRAQCDGEEYAVSEHDRETVIRAEVTVLVPARCPDLRLVSLAPTR